MGLPMEIFFFVFWLLWVIAFCSGNCGVSVRHLVWTAQAFQVVPLSPEDRKDKEPDEAGPGSHKTKGSEVGEDQGFQRFRESLPGKHAIRSPLDLGHAGNSVVADGAQKLRARGYEDEGSSPQMSNFNKGQDRRWGLGDEDQGDMQSAVLCENLKKEAWGLGLEPQDHEVERPRGLAHSSKIEAWGSVLETEESSTSPVPPAFLAPIVPPAPSDPSIPSSPSFDN
mmetsp:Transcript_2796/g.4564  ORF Transcript_2796/g.4564 Transcript_2796/m.4564 type:complete len:225 (-) Transcript_2796:367-1041(-)